MKYKKKTNNQIEPVTPKNEETKKPKKESLKLDKDLDFDFSNIKNTSTKKELVNESKKKTTPAHKIIPFPEPVPTPNPTPPKAVTPVPEPKTMTPIQEEIANLDIPDYLKEKYADFTADELEIVDCEMKIDNYFYQLRVALERAVALGDEENPVFSNHEYQTDLDSLQEKTYFLIDGLLIKQMRLLNKVIEQKVIEGVYTKTTHKRVSLYINHIIETSTVLKDNYKNSDKYEKHIDFCNKLSEMLEDRFR